VKINSLSLYLECYISVVPGAELCLPVAAACPDTVITKVVSIYF
jgi:hypothetical protein